MEGEVALDASAGSLLGDGRFAVSVRQLLRHTSGIRREEAAQLAFISTEYYTRLEQARGRRARCWPGWPMRTALLCSAFPGNASISYATPSQADQESRSAGHRAAASLTAMDLTIHATFLPHDDPGASLAFHRDTLGTSIFRASRSSLSSTRHTGSM